MGAINSDRFCIKSIPIAKQNAETKMHSGYAAHVGRPMGPATLKRTLLHYAQVFVCVCVCDLLASLTICCRSLMHSPYPAHAPPPLPSSHSPTAFSLSFVGVASFDLLAATYA